MGMGQDVGSGIIPNLIQANFQNVPSSYFIFVINPNNGSNTNGNVIFQAYSDLKLRYPEIPIYYIINNDGISEKNVQRYFEEVLKIPLSGSGNSMVKISGDLYKKCSRGNLLSVLEYVYNGSLYYASPFKVSYTPNISFPSNIVSVKFIKRVKISDKYLNTNLNFLRPCGDKILQLADANNRLSILDPETGNYEATLDMSALDPMDIFAKYISSDKGSIDTAKKYNDWLKKNNRLVLPIYNMYFDGKDIYVYFGLQYAKTVDESFLMDVKDMGGSVTSLKKGDVYFASTTFIMKCNTKLKVEHIYKCQAPGGDTSTMVDPDMTAAFFVEGNTIHAFNGASSYIGQETDSMKKSPYYNKGICRYKFPEDEKSNDLIFDGVDSPPFVEGVDKKTVYIDGNIFTWGHTLCAIYNTSPLIYALNQSAPIAKLHALGVAAPEIQEHYPNDLLDTSTLVFNWEFFTCASILNNKYEAFLYSYQQKIPLLELKDSKMHTVQVINLSELIPALTNPDYVKSNVVLMNDTIYVWIFEDGDFYLYSYQISKN